MLSIYTLDCMWIANAVSWTIVCIFWKETESGCSAAELQSLQAVHCRMFWLADGRWNWDSGSTQYFKMYFHFMLSLGRFLDKTWIPNWATLYLKSFLLSFDKLKGIKLFCFKLLCGEITCKKITLIREQSRLNWHQ